MIHLTSPYLLTTLLVATVFSSKLESIRRPAKHTKQFLTAPTTASEHVSSGKGLEAAASPTSSGHESDDAKKMSDMMERAESVRYVPLSTGKIFKILDGLKNITMVLCPEISSSNLQTLNSHIVASIKEPDEDKVKDALYSALVENVVFRENYFQLTACRSVLKPVKDYSPKSFSKEDEDAEEEAVKLLRESKLSKGQLSTLNIEFLRYLSKLEAIMVEACLASNHPTVTFLDYFAWDVFTRMEENLNKDLVPSALKKYSKPLKHALKEFKVCNFNVWRSTHPDGSKHIRQGSKLF